MAQPTPSHSQAWMWDVNAHGMRNCDVTSQWVLNLYVVKAHWPKHLVVLWWIWFMGEKWRLLVSILLFASKGRQACFLDTVGSLGFMASSVGYVLLFIPPLRPHFAYSCDASRNLNGNLYNMILVKNGN